MPASSNASSAGLKKRTTKHDTASTSRSPTKKPSKSKQPSSRSSKRSTWRWLSWACSASLFLLAYLTYQNNGELPTYLLNRTPLPSQSQPHSHHQHPFSQGNTPKDNWGSQGKAIFPSTKREPSLPYALPPTRPLPEQPLRQADLKRQSAILDAFNHSWSAYKRDAWGYDEYHPISKHGSNLSGKHGQGVGYTIVDTLDTLILLGLKQDYQQARDWVRDVLDWDVPGRMNVFETTIRTLGGLLSAAALIRDPPHPAFTPNEQDAQMFIARAVELAERLKPAFDTPSGVPLREVDLETGEAFPDLNNNNSSSLAEATTVQLEFKYLAHLTGNLDYWRIAERPMQVVRNATARLQHLQGLLPIFLNPINGHFYNGEIRLGSRGDSYYEYLVKQWLQTGRSEKVYREMYDHALRGIKRLLTKPSVHSKPPLMFTVELAPRRAMNGRPYMQLVPKQDHLVCFLGGAMMLGSTSTRDIFGDIVKRPLPPISDVGTGDETDKEDWRLGHELVRTCMDTYTKTKTGLSPEIAFFKTPSDVNISDAQMIAANRAPLPRNFDWYIKKPPPSYSGRPNPLIDTRNILRPETVESLFIAFSLTDHKARVAAQKQAKGTNSGPTGAEVDAHVASTLPKKQGAALLAAQTQPQPEPQAQVDDQGRTLGLEDPNDPALKDDPNTALRASARPYVVPVTSVSDPALLAEVQEVTYGAQTSIPLFPLPDHASNEVEDVNQYGFTDPRIYGGTSFDLVGNGMHEPLNIIISSYSSPSILTRKGFQSYCRALDFDRECLGLHAGGYQKAYIDPRGWRDQEFIYREAYTPFDHVFGTCIESLVGGNHIRAWQQQGSGAWFLATSREEDASKNHMIVPNGYNIGRNQLVQMALGKKRDGVTSFMWTKYKTEVEFVGGLMPQGMQGVNHDIAVDGLTAVLTVTVLEADKKAWLFSAKQEKVGAERVEDEGEEEEEGAREESADVVPTGMVAAAPEGEVNAGEKEKQEQKRGRRISLANRFSISRTPRQSVDQQQHPAAEKKTDVWRKLRRLSAAPKHQPAATADGDAAPPGAAEGGSSSDTVAEAAGTGEATKTQPAHTVVAAPAPAA
ncbi:hypothetical protein NDA16_003192 [Ustilago loliicola]|nr:hypothetical protein NDA16_003192 [Ustilago loliicola]